jgi:hypothetical protein
VTVGYEGRGPLKGRSYVVGDMIELRLIVEHQMNLMGCTAVFVLDWDPSISITLEGVPEPDETATSRMRRSIAYFSEEVGLEHIPGDYFLSYVEFYTASGQAIRHEYNDQVIMKPELVLRIEKELHRTSWITLEFDNENESQEEDG